MPSFVVLTLPILTTLLSGWLCHPRLAAWFNAALWLIVIIGGAVIAAQIFVLTGSVIADSMIIAGYCAGIMAGPLKALHAWLSRRTPSPFTAMPATITISMQAPTSPSPVRHWTSKPSVVPVSQPWQPSNHHGDTLSLPAASRPAVPPSQPPIRLSSIHHRQEVIS